MNYQVGMKVHINHINDPYANYDGREGMIVHIDDMGQLHGTWGSLALVPEEDSFDIIYDYTPLYYATPCQVRWYNIQDHQWHAGIAYKDELILDDGAVDKIDAIVKAAQTCGIHWDDAVVELNWLPLK